jgi:hypothetical protein
MMDGHEKRNIHVLFGIPDMSPSQGNGVTFLLVKEAFCFNQISQQGK